MKVHHMIMAAGVAMICAACSTELKEDVSFDAGIVTNENVTFDGQVYTVKKGTPVDFQFHGSPDFITFFSGEAGSNYQYRNRTTIAVDEIKSSVLTFTVQNQYGNAETNAGAVSMFYSDDFTGLEKNNFEKDSVLVESFAWNDLVPQSDLPQKPESKSFTVDLMAHMGKPFTLAIRYKPQTNSGNQPRVNFQNMKIVNTMKNGQQTSLSAGSLGFTALNMRNKWNLTDQNIAKPVTYDRKYGTVTNNTPGLWNLASSGVFYIHSSPSGNPLKYGWLVSDPVVINACEPDAGTKVKDISQDIHSYSYTYNQVGTYNATFLVRNANYEHSSEKVVHVIVNVVE